MAAYVTGTLDDVNVEFAAMAECVAATRYLKAREHFRRIETIVDSLPTGQQREDLLQRLHSNEWSDLSSRCTDIDKALREFHMEAGDGWTLGMDMFGYKTHYVLEDDGNVLVRVEGSQTNLPLFELMATIREIPLYHEWMPFCNKSYLVHKISDHDLISYLNIWSLVGISRDMVVRGFGADCLQETGKIVICVSSCDSYPEAELPPPTTGWFHDRARLIHMYIVFDLTGPESANVCMHFF
jgi:hypothetical protein